MYDYVGVTYVAVSATGTVSCSDIIGAIQYNTCLVSIMLSNNETGVIMPVASIAR